MKTTTTLVTAIALIMNAGASMATPTKGVKTSGGTVMAAESNGMTLYTFRKDRRGISNCAGSCAASWPPFLADGSVKANDGSKIIKRSDGTLQWATANGMPLYFWAGDSSPGDTNGDGVGGVWDVVR